MQDIKNPKLVWLKALVFLLIGIASSALLLFESPTLRVGLLLAVTIWACGRGGDFARRRRRGGI